MRRAWRLLALRAAGAGLLGLLLIADAEASDRLAPADVSLENVEVFENQIRQDLPLGTAKQDVEAYLMHWRIPNKFIDPSPGYGDLGNSFFAELRNIGTRPPFFTANLVIRVYLDEGESVRNIAFRIEYE